MPNFVRWKKIAPDIIPSPIKAPNKVVRGIKIKIAAINSAMPVPILPQGSMPSVVNNDTDCGWAVNLKNNVCNKMRAASILKTQVNIFFSIMMQCYGNIQNVIVCQVTK